MKAKISHVSRKKGVESMDEDFETTARHYWEKNLPEMVKIMKEEGEYDKEIEKAVMGAKRELARRVARGEQYWAAREDVLDRWIYLPIPEKTTE